MNNILNKKVLVATVIIASVLLCGSLIYILVARPAASSLNTASAIGALTVIPAPSSTPGMPPPTLTSIPSTPMPTPTPGPGELAVGVYVQISNTGEEGLNIRSQPGLTGPISFSGYDAEAFLVTDGPQLVDGYTWWYLTASYDVTRFGWAAQDFLEVIDLP